ncbi:MAG: ABC-F family ATP-binding cassette domain-containing protein [Streptosporangiaceae bacterium]
MNLINFENVRKSYGTTVLLDGVSLGVAARERIGVVGRNGGGKTTLATVLAGTSPPDAGRVTHARGLRVGYLPQREEVGDGRTVREVVLGDVAEHRWAGDPRVREVVEGLFGGLDAPLLAGGLDASVGRLSGGERRRVALARVLVPEHDLIVLDEPTNHLDIEAVDWLAGHLRGRSCALVIVTHDRWLLDTVCDQTWEVEGGRAHQYEGGYSAYVLARAERARLAHQAEERRRNLLRKELAWLRRGPQARTSKPKFRIEAANALIEGEPAPRDTVELTRFATSRLGKRVYDLRDVTLRAGDRTILERFTWQLGPGERVGVIGVNGTGKTSLLRLLAGEVAADAGRVVTGATVRTAHLSQDAAELDPGMRVLEALERVRRVVRMGKRELTASQLAERLGFAGNRQWTLVRDLSGGERRRLQLARLLMDEPNVLLLDEPTNDLDIDTLTNLEDLLDGWPGSLVVVSHDRYFLERVTDHVAALLGDRKLSYLPGGVDDYLRRIRAHRAAPPVRPGAGEGRKPAGAERAHKKELARLERRLDKITRRESELHERLAAHAADYEKLLELDAEARELGDEKKRVEDAWLALAEQVE